MGDNDSEVVLPPWTSSPCVRDFAPRPESTFACRPGHLSLRLPIMRYVSTLLHRNSGFARPQLLEIIVSLAPRYLPHYTVADHAAWEGDWELLGGVAVAMTPSPFGPHAERLSRLAAALWNGIDASGCHATVLAEIDWIIANDTVVRPDLVVMCGPAPKRHVEQPPALVVEILSDATRSRDQIVKRELYEANGVRWYLMIDPDEDRSSLLRLGQAGRYEALPTSGRQDIDLCPDCKISLSLDFGR